MAKIFTTKIVPGSGTGLDSPAEFHPSGQWIATTGIQANHFTRIDCKTAITHTFGENPHPISTIAFDHSGDRLIAIDENIVSFWNVQSNAPLHCIYQNSTTMELPEDGVVPTLAINGDLFWIFGLNEWTLWSTKKCELLMSLKVAAGERVLRVGHTSSKIPFAITYDEENRNHPTPTLSTVNLQSQDIESRIALDEWVDVLISLDGKTAVLQSSSNTIDVWDMKAGRYLHSIQNVRLGLHPSFVANHRQIVTHPIEKNDSLWCWIELIDVFSKDRIRFDSLSPFRPRISCSPYANLLVTVANDNRHPIDSTCFWDSETGKLIAETTGHLGHPFFSPCGKWFATVSNNACEETAVNHQPGGTVRITKLELN